jgi:hypothetical protein
MRTLYHNLALQSTRYDHLMIKTSARTPHAGFFDLGISMTRNRVSPQLGIIGPVGQKGSTRAGESRFASLRHKNRDEVIKKWYPRRQDLPHLSIHRPHEQSTSGRGAESHRRADRRPMPRCDPSRGALTLHDATRTDSGRFKTSDMLTNSSATLPGRSNFALHEFAEILVLRLRLPLATSRQAHHRRNGHHSAGIRRPRMCGPCPRRRGGIRRPSPIRAGAPPKRRAGVPPAISPRSPTATSTK